MEANKISYDIPFGTAITAIFGLPVAAVDYVDLSNKFPHLYWVEQDSEGIDHLCTFSVDRELNPIIDCGPVQYKGYDFVPTKTEGDRPRWRPRPYRP